MIYTMWLVVAVLLGGLGPAAGEVPPPLNVFSVCLPFCKSLEACTDFTKYPPPYSCPIIYYKLITPGWLRDHSYLLSHVESNDGKRVVFNIGRHDFSQLAYIPVIPPGTKASNEDIVIDITLSLQTPSRDSDMVFGLCSRSTCYGILINDHHQNWPSCPFFTFTNTGKMQSGHAEADCSGSSQRTGLNYPEEVHIRYYPKYAWISYYIAQNGGISVIGQFQDSPDLSYGLTIEFYGDNEDNESIFFQYLELEVKKNSYKGEYRKSLCAH